MKKIMIFLVLISNIVFCSINDKFISAFESGNISEIKTALKSGANINTVNYLNNSALTVSLRNNRRDIAKFLIENGINVNIVESVLHEEDNFYHKSALIIATEKNDTEMMELLFAKGAKISYQKGCDLSPIIAAAKNNATDALLLLIKKGVNVNKDEKGYIPIIEAACFDAKEAVEILIQNNANIEAKGLEGDTPLLYSLSSGSEKTSFFLIQNNADIRVKNNNGFSTLHYAVKNNCNCSGIKKIEDNF